MRSEEYVGHRHGMLVISEYLGLKRFPSGGQLAFFRFVGDCGNWFDAQKGNVIGKRTLQMPGTKKARP